MPTNITDSPEFTANVPVPIDGENVDAASVLARIQPLANRIRFLSDYLLGENLQVGAGFSHQRGLDHESNWTRTTVRANTTANTPLYIPISDRLINGAELDEVEFYYTKASASGIFRLQVVWAVPGSAEAPVVTEDIVTASPGGTSVIASSVGHTISLYTDANPATNVRDYFIKAESIAPATGDVGFEGARVTMNITNPRP